MERLLVRPAEAGKLLSLGRSTVYALLRAGSLPSIRVGRSTRVPLDALKAWIARQATAIAPMRPEASDVGARSEARS